MITTKDGPLICFKGWASGRPVVLRDPWPLSAYAGENQKPGGRRPPARVAGVTPTTELSDERSLSRSSSVAICACSIKTVGQGITVRR